MILLNGKKIDVTMFPDKTSQVWNIDLELSKLDHCDITWEFEHEGELMHVLQLNHLLKSFELTVSLSMPYLPYARQDKPVSNKTTFALRTFARVINAADFTFVKVFDPHNRYLSEKIFKNFRSEPVILDRFIKELAPTHICYPDLGAMTRYNFYFPQVEIMYAEKDRDQQTGEILGVRIVPAFLDSRVSNPLETVLIVDDLADGGGTFIKLAYELKKSGFKDIHLYVSHGLFTKGTQVLRDAGIKRIFTRKGEIE